MNLLINNVKNNLAAFFIYAKSATNTFFTFMVQIFKRLADLILQIRQKSGRTSLYKCELKIK